MSFSWTYAPDTKDERTPGILLSGSANVVPTNRGGMRNAYLPPYASGASGQPSYPDISGLVFGSRYLLRSDGSDRMFAGTASKLYEANQTVSYAWTDVSRGGNYSGATQWLFKAFGDMMLAVISVGTRTEIQQSTGAVGTAFANLTNAPKAKIIVCSSGFIIAFDYDSTGTAVPNGWICCDFNSPTNWTLQSGECNAGVFTDTPGPITAAIEFGDGIVVFKNKGMYFGRYIGLPEVWRFDRISPSIGCSGPLAVECVEDVLYWTDSSGFWMYDGSRPRLLSADLSTELRGYINTSSVGQAIQLGVDDYSNIISIMLGSSGSAATIYYPYNYRTGAWGPQCSLNPANFGGQLAVSAVCNGQYDKMHNMPGMSGSGATVNAYWWMNDGAGSGRFRNFNGNLIDLDDDNVIVLFSIIPNIFGNDGEGSMVTRIYHDFRSYTVSATGAGGGSSSSDSLTAYRRPFDKGYQQASASGSYSSTFGYTDIRASGNWFKEQLSFGFSALADSAATGTIGFEWIGFTPEYAAGSKPRK